MEDYKKRKESEDTICNGLIKNKSHKDFIARSIHGSEEIYGVSISFSEVVRSIGFDGILYKTRTTTDALGPFNDPMLVVYEPADGRELFTNVVLAKGASK